MLIHFSYRGALGIICISLMLILALPGCADAGAAPKPAATGVAPANSVSTASFTFSGGKSASYTLHTSVPTSELRHGHREFTILLTDADVSLFIVFYGYQGPGKYTLQNAVNGGDVHIGLEHNTLSWDLVMQPAAHCALTVDSDTPTSRLGLDRMRGSFACPLLFSSSPAHPQKPITVEQGSFDIAMLITS